MKIYLKCFYVLIAMLGKKTYYRYSTQHTLSLILSNNICIIFNLKFTSKHKTKNLTIEIFKLNASNFEIPEIFVI